MMRRQLNIELLRIFSMFLICLWHVNGHILPLLPKEVSVVDGIFARITPYITIHVDLFVLITGYFGIRHCSKSLFKTCSLVFSYAVILGLITLNIGSEDFKWTQLLPFSGSPWWFMRVYLVLLLISPVIENYLRGGEKKVYLLLFITTFINVYLGWFRHISLYDHHGYDVLNFTNIYPLAELN